MFADLLQLELRRTAPGQITGLHQAAAAWLAGHGFPVDAVRHGELSWRGSSRARRVLNHLVWVAIGHLGGR
jgi:LuxR family maltose regulon positive regulatory protein